MFDLKQLIFSRLSIEPEDQVYHTLSGKRLADDSQIFEDEQVEFTTLNLNLRLLGGKGGFGSMLRAQGGKMASQKTTNFEACRDLNGRRLRTVNEAKRLADHLEQEPDRQRIRKEKVQKKIEEGLAEPPTKRIRFDDTEYLKASEEMKEKVSNAVSEAISKKSVVVNNNNSGNGDPGRALSLWDVVVLSEDDSRPGFDVLGVSLSLYLTVELDILESEPDKSNEVVLTYSGEGADTLTLNIEKNLITKTALYVLSCNNIEGFPSPLNIHVDNPIPLGRGLGSSGTAIVAGVMLGNVVGNLGLTKERMLDYCLMIEHHPDNVTAALMGGFVASYVKRSDQNVTPHSETPDSNGDGVVKASVHAVPEGMGHYVKLNWAKEIKAVTIIPQFEVSTADARNVLPKEYGKQDVVFNLQRLAVLIMALSCSPPKADLIYQAMQDKVHQPYRKHLIPGLSEILASVKPDNYPGLLGVCLSGAGPTILALATQNFDGISEAIKSIFAEKGIETVTRVLDVVDDGAQVTGIQQ
ncbi:16733_t:CDS:2 [Acaulospora colombiana]|uniref:16733_t:CDS:1 n=1 Tax=Acaulospora colombiana TaxID=27376 RepID=A0ACA9KZ94_9GLOM|nr:16733_t:CDS:2 [Acaulospora colombiana]